MAEVKTNVLRILDKEKIDYACTTYDTKDGKIDGVSVAHKVGKPVEQVFKTLIVRGKGKDPYVCVIPVEKELNLKKVSELTGEKKVEMLPVNDLLKITGYMRGGCSPIGMKKLFKTYIDSSAEQLAVITVSAGKIGIQVDIAPERLREIVKGEYVYLT